MTDVLVTDGPDAGLVWHGGDPLREQRLLSQGEGLVRLGNRGVLRIEGPDRLTWLHSLTTQHLTALPPAAGSEALVLSPHGHVEHHLRLVDDGAAVWATVEPGTLPALLDYLQKMRFWSQVELTDVTDEVESVWVPAPDHPLVALATERGLPVIATAEPALAAVTSAPLGVLPGAELLLPRAQVEALTSGVPRAGVWAREALRVAAGVPRLGLETDHRTIPHEVGWIGTAVHLDKGCYRGQETVARVHNLGRPPRRLTLLHLDGSDNVLPGHGDEVVLDASSRVVGFVGTAVQHFELGPVALALVKRSVPVDQPVLVRGVTATQEVVGSVDEGGALTGRPSGAR
ncbi:MAG: CAF17-like 4Fe-4S cluster assembly/insertion protein YgfZ [Actinomycetales bacterium]